MATRNAVLDLLGRGSRFFNQAQAAPYISDSEPITGLDHYHLIEAQPIHHALIFPLDHRPPQLHLIIASSFREGQSRSA